MTSKTTNPPENIAIDPLESSVEPSKEENPENASNDYDALDFDEDIMMYMINL